MQIFPNGTMYFDVPTGTPQADLDSNGLPVSVIALEQSVTCTINTLTEHKRGKYDDGRYKNCSYSVTFNMDEVELNFAPPSVRLFHENKGNLGTFQVQRLEYYNITQTIEIWV